MQWENKKMKQYKLLTPGPLTTTESVKKEMMFDHCTGTMITNRSHRTFVQVY